MKKPLCSVCNGLGDYEDSTGKLMECFCSRLRRCFASMPPHIFTSNITDGHLSLGIHKMVDSSLFIRSTWSDMKPILKAVMIKWFEKKVVRVTSDREIRDVFVGSKSKLIQQDDDRIVYNNLQDLMEPVHERLSDATLLAMKKDLVIVRLNELSYKNKAASGALEEAVSFRVDRNKPTWIISDLDKPFGPGSHAYSDSVWNLLVTSFKGIDIPRITVIDMNKPNISRPPVIGQQERQLPQISMDVLGTKPETVKPKPKPLVEETKLTPEVRTTRELPITSIKSVPDELPIDESEFTGVSKIGQGIKKKRSTFSGK